MVKFKRLNKKITVGDKFGLLTVIKLGFRFSLYKGVLKPDHILRCECGTYCAVKHNRVHSAKSCGCLLGWALKTGDHSRKPWGESYFNRVVRGIKRNASSRNISFELTINDIKELIFNECHYCGNYPSTVAGLTGNTVDRHNGRFKTNGIDRKDNNIGYTKENCVTCCKNCNLMKMTLPYDLFFKQIYEIAQHHAIMPEF